jgi:hypothetical protein
MADTTQMNLNVKRETRQRVAKIAELTNRKPGNVIDWLVADAWARIHPVTETGATAPISDGEVFAGA